jgi:hypothetical protein
MLLAMPAGGDILSFAVALPDVDGRHPYGRVRATRRRHKDRNPNGSNAFTRRQWRTLARALAFNRSDRPRDMNEVSAGLRACRRAWSLLAYGNRPGPVALWLNARRWNGERA